MSEYNKPLPLVEPGAEPFWQSCREHAMQIQRCDGCSSHRYPPALHCPKCLSTAFSWVPVSGRGTVWAALTVHRGAGAFADATPYNVSLLELPEGVRLWSNVVGCPPSDVRIGMTVQLEYDDVTPEWTLPRFRPAGGPG